MANIKPFKAFRPTRDKVHLVASRSYISYNKPDLTRKLDENPFTFLHILNPEYKTKRQSFKNSKDKFEKVRTKFTDFANQQILIQDKKESFYVYRQIKEGHPYLGIIACASVNDYYTNVIKKHEATITKREEIFKKYLEIVQINAEPVCFTYPNHEKIDRITNEKILDRPEYDFTTANRDRHSLWKIEDEETVAKLINYFAEVQSIYIADGHHRSASSALLGKSLREQDGNPSEEKAYDYFMGYFIPENGLKIFEFNRLITTIGDHDVTSFLEAIKENFELAYVEGSYFRPQKVHEIGMYIAVSYTHLTLPTIYSV